MTNTHISDCHKLTCHSTSYHSSNPSSYIYGIKLQQSDSPVTFFALYFFPVLKFTHFLYITMQENMTSQKLALRIAPSCEMLLLRLKTVSTWSVRIHAYRPTNNVLSDGPTVGPEMNSIQDAQLKFQVLV